LAVKLAAMSWESEARAEGAVEVAAGATFAGAVGFACWAMASGAAAVLAAVVSAFLVAVFGLRRVAPETRTYALPRFPLETVEPVEPTCGDPADELILEDELGEVSPHARVVRLFGPGQSHLRRNREKPAPPDASQALVEALAELRRSLH
jgi:hypothetical protein